MLVEYAGKDPDEPAIDAPETKYLHRKTHTRPEMAYRLFRMGRDTLQLSLRFKRDEATILRWITNERCRQRGLADPFERKAAAKNTNRILVVDGIRGVKS